MAADLGQWAKVQRRPLKKKPLKRLGTPADKSATQSLGILTFEEDLQVYSLTGPTPPGFTVVEAVVDSGAEQSVAPPGIFPDAVCPSAMSQSGRGYRAANGTRIRNLGETDVFFSTVDGVKCGMPFQIAEVERPLIAASQLGLLVIRSSWKSTAASLSTKRAGGLSH